MINELGPNDWRFKAIKQEFETGDQQAVGQVVCNNPIAKWQQVEDALLDASYGDMVQFFDELGLEEDSEAKAMMEVSRLRKLAGILNEEEDDFDLSVNPLADTKGSISAESLITSGLADIEVTPYSDLMVSRLWSRDIEPYIPMSGAELIQASSDELQEMLDQMLEDGETEEDLEEYLEEWFHITDEGEDDAMAREYFITNKEAEQATKGYTWAGSINYGEEGHWIIFKK